MRINHGERESFYLLFFTNCINLVQQFFSNLLLKRALGLLSRENCTKTAFKFLSHTLSPIIHTRSLYYHFPLLSIYIQSLYYPPPVPIAVTTTAVHTHIAPATPQQRGRT